MNMNARLSEHFTLGEMIKTSAKGIDNTPAHGAVMNLKNLCENWLEDLRFSYNMLYGGGDTPRFVISSAKIREIGGKVVPLPLILQLSIIYKVKAWR